jgi:predicted DNA-binding transcriptional regulator YafY
MAKRSDTMETVNLALALLQRIPHRRLVSAEELREQLEREGYSRDIRTIQRLLKSLCEHQDIECIDNSRPFGYRWKEGAKGLSLPGLGPKESLILALAAQQLKPLLPANVFKSMEPFFDQAARNLDPTSKARREREWLKKVLAISTTQPLLPPKIPRGIFEAVSDALYGNLWLKVDYANSSGGRSKGSVMPLGLAQQGPRLYLVCRYDGFNNNRILALHRIKSAEVGTLSFERPKDFDLTQYAEDGQFGFGTGKRVRLEFCIAKEAGMHLLETPLSVDQTVKETQDHYKFKATVVDSLLLDRWLRGFGNDVQLVRKRRTNSTDSSHVASALASKLRNQTNRTSQPDHGDKNDKQGH